MPELHWLAKPKVKRTWRKSNSFKHIGASLYRWALEFIFIMSTAVEVLNGEKSQCSWYCEEWHFVWFFLGIGSCLKGSHVCYLVAIVWCSSNPSHSQAILLFLFPEDTCMKGEESRYLKISQALDSVLCKWDLLLLGLFGLITISMLIWSVFFINTLRIFYFPVYCLTKRLFPPDNVFAYDIFE